MADEFTACLAVNEMTVRQILTTDPFNHVYVQTIGPFNGGNLHLNVYPKGDTVGQVGSSVDPGAKVIIQTQST